MTRVLVAGGLLAIGSVACSSSANEHSRTIEIRGERVAVTELRGVVEALCEAKDLAARDPEASGTIFFDRVHAPLHDIAAATEEVDRPSAARLLEAKQAVEQDIQQRPELELASDLQELIAATRDALKELSVRIGGCDG
jgi:hypothetical protein